MKLRPLISEFKIRELSWIFWIDSVYLQESLKAEEEVFRDHQKQKKHATCYVGLSF